MVSKFTRGVKRLVLTYSIAYQATHGIQFSYICPQRANNTHKEPKNAPMRGQNHIIVNQSSIITCYGLKFHQIC